MPQGNKNCYQFAKELIGIVKVPSYQIMYKYRQGYKRTSPISINILCITEMNDNQQN